MKERPILMTSEMVRATLDGRKTQTRRIVKPQPDSIHEGEPYWHVGGLRLRTNARNKINCPFGSAGDRLWVRETWQALEQGQADEPCVVYRATDPDWETTPEWRWKSSAVMPRWASRITLEITEVRVERLQEDAKGDGYSSESLALNPWFWAIKFKMIKESK